MLLLTADPMTRNGTMVFIQKVTSTSTAAM